MTMTSSPTTSMTSRGFSLLEVLIAVVILSFGLLALASMQLSLVRASADSKTQTIAAALAKDKIESLRAFHSLDTAGDVTRYRLIDSEGAVTLADSGGDQGGVDFTRSTTVTRYVFDRTVGAFATSTSSPAITNLLTDAQIIALNSGSHTFVPGKDFKRVRVNVGWTDASGTAQTIGMEDVIDSLAPEDSAKVAKNSSGSSPRKIQVIIVNPGSVGGVIPIAIGNGNSTAASNPTPEVKGNSNTVSETRFDVFTYAGLTQTTALAQSRVETTVFHCTCSTANGPGGTTARGYRPTFWNGYRYVPPALTTYVPPAGWTSVSTESDRCTDCCRDHNDPSGVSGAKFDPWRSGAHSHFRLSGSTLVAAPTGAYDEACRMIRTDGIFRVAADLRDDYFALLETNNSGSISDTDQNARPYAPTTGSGGATANYQDFVLDYLDDRVSANTNSTTFNTPLAVASYETAHNLNNPSLVYIRSDASRANGTSKWLHARGLYVDWLEPAAITAITTAKTNCADTSTQALRNACVLPYVPFTSINVTELANWKIGTAAVSDTTMIQVANAGFYDPTNSNVPTRGEVTHGSSATVGDTPAAYSHMSESNAGVALFDPIDDEESLAFTQTSPSKGHDRQPFLVANNAPPPPGTISFSVTISGEAAGSVYPQIGASAGSYTCGIQFPNAATDPGIYSCAMAPDGAGNMLMKVAGYTKATTLLVPNGCRSSGSTPMPINIDYDVATASPNGSVGTVTGNGTITDTTQVTFNPVTAGSTLSIRFTGPVRYCPTNYAVQANNNSSGLSCAGNGSNAAPTWPTTYQICPSGTP